MSIPPVEVMNPPTSRGPHGAQAPAYKHWQHENVCPAPGTWLPGKPTIWEWFIEPVYSHANYGGWEDDVIA
jgi:hypothetical protein